MAKLTVQRHPLLIDHETQTEVTMDLRPGESLYTFLHRHILNLDGMAVTVHVKNKPVPRHLWPNVYIKHGNDIMVRTVVEKTALLIIALVVLSIFTMGAAAAIAGAAVGGGVIGAAGAAMVTGLGAMGITGMAASIVVGAVQVIGAMIINKVLGPKPPSASSIDRDNVYSLNAVRNGSRQYEPPGLLIGEVRVTPDVISIPYSTYRGNDQYMSFVLSPGINVAAYEQLYIGNTPITDFEEIKVWQAGFSDMEQQVIPVATNPDSLPGAEMPANVTVTRTGSPDTVRLQVDITYLLFDLTSKGKKKDNQEQVNITYRLIGTNEYKPFPPIYIVSREQTQQRRSYVVEVPAGQYEVNVTRLGLDTGTRQPDDSDGATCEFTWATLVSYQRDTSTYRGLARLAMEMRASGQFSGTPDQVRGLMRAKPIPLWNGTEWVMATRRVNGLSNVAANTLQMIRGYYDEDGVLIAGLGWPDEQIDIESFKAWMLDCTQYHWNYDFWISNDRSVEDALGSIALAGMGKIDFAPGKATAVWAAPNQPVEAIVNMGTILKTTFQVDYTLLRTADGIEYSYNDRNTWDTATMKVEAPGVETMLNPARLSGEGVTELSHAAMMARYHMGQMIYQLKDVAFQTHIEFMTYGMMSILQLSHDLTQWGYSGRLNGFYINDAFRPVLQLDDAVPHPGEGRDAYVGVRIPGELVYRVFTVRPFVGERRTIELVEPWPVDARQPGDDLDANPAADSLWIYDFKSTPGLRVRVVSISPADDLKSAQIAVVPESDEFWNYVLTGEYIPPVNESLLNTAPIASNLVCKEVRVAQGNTIVSQINATWSVTGKADFCLVTCGRDGEPGVTVAQTDGRSASWLVDGPGDYIITVRPFRDGNPGKIVTGFLLVYGENQPPRVPDVFAIDDLEGGIRKYAWGWFPSTIQSTDFAGVEIRYIAGSLPTPVWDSMTPLGDDEGFHTASFESTEPPSGQWTFSLRARNTAGVLSDTQIVMTKALSKNLGQRYLETVQQLTLNEQRLTSAIEQVDVMSETIIQQELNISQINGREVQNRAFISQLQTTTVTKDEARALIEQQIGVSLNDLQATVQTHGEAIADINGDLSAYYNIKVQTTANGRSYLAGIGVGIDMSGGVAQSEIAMLADRFVFMNSVGANAGYYYPFEIVNGIVYANAAMIRDGTITNAKIGEEIKSLNYHWDGTNNIYEGWRIGKDGTAQFGGDVEVRGDVSARSITGSFETSIAVSWSGSISNGGVSAEFELPAPLNATQSHRPELTLALQLRTGDGQDATSCTITLQRQNPANPSEWWNITSREYAIFKFTNSSQAFMFLDDWTNVPNRFRFRIVQINGQAISLTNINGRIRGAR